MKMLTTAAALAAVLVSAGAAMAVPVPGAKPTAPPTNTHRGQYASNADLRTARRHIELAIDRLQHDVEDYGGHREKAVEDLGKAIHQLEKALEYSKEKNQNKNQP